MHVGDAVACGRGGEHGRAHGRKGRSIRRSKVEGRGGESGRRRKRRRKITKAKGAKYTQIPWTISFLPSPSVVPPNTGHLV
jgi:hypothetical protein